MLAVLRGTTRLPRIADWLWDNPIVRRERTKRPAAAPLPQLGVAAGTVALVVGYFGAAFGLSQETTTEWQARVLLLVLCLLYLLLVSFTVPGRAAGAISGERERETLQALLLTSLRPSQIACGKLLIALLPAACALLGLAPLLLMTMHHDNARLSPAACTGSASGRGPRHRSLSGRRRWPLAVRPVPQDGGRRRARVPGDGRRTLADACLVPAARDPGREPMVVV
jgi:hypothetical protein